MDNIIPDMKAVRNLSDALVYGWVVLSGIVILSLVQTQPHELEIALFEVRDGRVFQLANPTSPSDVIPASATAQITGPNGEICGGFGARPYEWKAAPINFSFSEWTYGDDCTGMVPGIEYRADLTLQYTHSDGGARHISETVFFTFEQEWQS